MKIFNIEEKNGKKEYVCYIQLKDLDYLEEKGINLESYKDIDKYMYVFSKSTLKSFARIDILDDVIKIRDNSEEIVDLGKVLSNGVSIYDEEIRNEEKEMYQLMNYFWFKNKGFYKGHLKEDDTYNEWRKKGEKLKNKLDDLKDINDITLGKSKVNLPQVPFYNSVIKRIGEYLVYRGINPNEYIIFNKDGKSFNYEAKEKIKKYKGTDLSNSIIPMYASSAILKDVNNKYGVDNNIEYKYMMSEDNKYIIVRTKNKINKTNKSMELVK